MVARLLLFTAALAVAACSRGGPPPPAVPSASPTAPAPAASDPTELATASETPTEALDLTGPLADLAVIPSVSNDDLWVPVGQLRTIADFGRWQRSRGITGTAADLAAELDEQYGFDSEVQVAYVSRRGAKSEHPRTRQLLVSRFSRGDDGLSQAWCAVDEEGRQAIELPDTAVVQRAVDALVALPGSCGAVRRVAGDAERFQADISFRFGRHMVQVVAVERSPVTALRAIGKVAPLVHDRLVDRAD